MIVVPSQRPELYLCGAVNATSLALGPLPACERAACAATTLPIVMWPLLVLQVLESFAYYTLANILTLHLTDVLGLSDVNAGFHFGMRATVSTFFSTLGGPVIDLFGPKRVLPTAFTVAAIGRIAFALATTPDVALAAMYLPMAIGHGLTNAALTICIKRATSRPDGPSAAWGFAMQYCAIVFGITVCGPTIDIATARLQPALPYRSLALVSGACSVIGACASVAVLYTSSADVSAAKPLWKRHSNGSGGLSASLSTAVVELRRVICTRRFARYVAFSVAILPGHSVLRNLDGGIFPKFMVRTFGADVPKGSIYAINPLLDLIGVPLLTRGLRSARHYALIRVGLTVASASPLVVPALGASIASVIAFVLVLTLGDVLYNPRLAAYAMAVAPDGREGSFAGLMHAVIFLAEMPAGLLGGWLLERHCSSAAKCDARGLFGELAAFALLTPLMLWACPSLLREPSADVRGDSLVLANNSSGASGAAQHAETELRRADVAAALAAADESSAEEVDALVASQTRKT